MFVVSVTGEIDSVLHEANATSALTMILVLDVECLSVFRRSGVQVWLCNNETYKKLERNLCPTLYCSTAVAK